MLISISLPSSAIPMIPGPLVRYFEHTRAAWHLSVGWVWSLLAASRRLAAIHLLPFWLSSICLICHLVFVQSLERSEVKWNLVEGQSGVEKELEWSPRTPSTQPCCGRHSWVTMRNTSPISSRPVDGATQPSPKSWSNTTPHLFSTCKFSLNPWLLLNVCFLVVLV